LQQVITSRVDQGMQGAVETSEAGGSEPERIGTPLWRGPVPWLIACGALLVAAIMIGTIVMANGFRQRAIGNSERELENTVVLLSRHFAQQFEDAETAVSQAIRRMQPEPISSPEAFRIRMAMPDIRDMLRSQVNGLSYMGELTIIDANGDFANWSSNDPLPAINVTDRSYFKDLKSASRPDSVVIVPVISRVTGGWVTIVAHRLSGANGEFLGVLTRRVDPKTYETFLEAMALGNGESITLLHSSGAVLARYPHIESMMGAKAGNSEMLNGLTDGAVRTTQITDRADGNRWRGSSRTAARRSVRYDIFPACPAATHS